MFARLIVACPKPRAGPLPAGEARHMPGGQCQPRASCAALLHQKNTLGPDSSCTLTWLRWHTCPCRACSRSLGIPLLRLAVGLGSALGPARGAGSLPITQTGIPSTGTQKRTSPAAAARGRGGRGGEEGMGGTGMQLPHQPPKPWLSRTEAEVKPLLENLCPCFLPGQRGEMGFALCLCLGPVFAQCQVVFTSAGGRCLPRAAWHGVAGLGCPECRTRQPFCQLNPLPV